MPYLDLDAIKREMPMRKVLDLIGWCPIWSQGDQSRGPCPLHHSSNRRSRSFAVCLDGWYCHKCKIGGDCLALWVLLHNLSTVDAAKDLCGRLGVPVYCKPRFVPDKKTRNSEEAR